MTPTESSDVDSLADPPQAAIHLSASRQESSALFEMMKPLHVGTDDFYPFRRLLNDSDAVEEIETIVAARFEELLHCVGDFSFVAAACQLQEDLCGEEPLTTRRLLAYLDAVAAVARRMLVRQVDRWRQEKSGKEAVPPVASTTVGLSRSTIIPGAGAISKLTFGQQAEEFAAPPAGMTLVAARQSPEVVDRKLAVLAQLEREKPDLARWFQLMELTGSMADELARYFTIPVKTMERSLAEAISRICKEQ
ncbi:MAG: hypothetical protein SFV23_16855 [Planctomycetaceae bacterium]|nr:hypothetical protein [Planctomycetaceae bacterium]